MIDGSGGKDVAVVARALSEVIGGAAVDTGDDRVQVLLDDVLDLLDARLARLAEDHDDVPR